MQKVESRLKMQEYVEKDRQKQLERKNKMLEIKSNKNYILWLEKYTMNNPKFRDDDVLYDSLNKEDIENINNLYLFFDGIDEYAKNNYIYPSKEADFVSYYRVKYNNVGYEVGYINNDGNYYFCEKTNYVDDTFIDYNDIINHNKQYNTDYINKRLAELYLLINYFYEQNIPYQAIKETVENALWNISENSINKSKVLKKTI